MAIKRHFFPSDGEESIVLKTLLPGEHDFFRDFSEGNSLGRLVLSECSRADSGGSVVLFYSETQVVKANHLIVPIIEVEEGEAVITIDEGEEFELPVRTLEYGIGSVLYRHDTTPPFLSKQEAA